MVKPKKQHYARTGYRVLPESDWLRVERLILAQRDITNEIDEIISPYKEGLEPSTKDRQVITWRGQAIVRGTP